ncbi:MAG: efflux RND transporter permease subunit [Candidatus Saccharimonadales bacterium]
MKRLHTAPLWLRVLLPTVLITIWFALAGLGGPYFGRIEEVSDVDLAAFLPKSAEATKVNAELAKFRDGTTIPAIIVFTPKDGTFDAIEETAVNDRRDEIQSVTGVTDEVSPAVISQDSKAALMIAQVDTNEKVVDVLEKVDATLSEPSISGVSYKITGPAGFAADLTAAFGGIDGVLLLTALSVVFVILIIVYRSILLPILVLMTSMFALAVSILIVWNLAKAGYVTLNGQVQGILFILVIGAATDYSLLYISRYREELYKVKSKWIATLEALKGAFEPIIASGGTVIVGLLCLLLSDLASNKALGPVGAVGIALSVLSALTLLPMLLFVFGRASFWPTRPLADTKHRKEHEKKLRTGLWHRVGDFVARHPRPIWIVTAVVLLIAAAGYPQLKADGVAQSDLIVGKSQARDGQEILGKHFPDGSGSPALIIAPEGSYEKIAAKLETDNGIDTVSVTATDSPNNQKPFGRQQDQIKADIRKEVQAKYDVDLAALQAEEDALASQIGPEAAAMVFESVRAGIPSVESIVEEAYPFKEAQVRVVDGEVLIQATLTDAADSQAAKETIARIRPLVRGVDQAALVGGPTAVQYDTNQASIRDRQVIIPIVLIAITLILMVLLRSIIAPILLLATTVVSFGASLGVAAILFNNVWQFPGADPTVLLYGFVFLVALGIDYNIFLMTRVREESIKHGTQKGVIQGLVVTGGVITSAGIVLAATFAALAVIPILFLFQLAFIVAFGVLLDTIIVRSLLVPALIKDIGSFVWWPSKLTKKK